MTTPDDRLRSELAALPEVPMPPDVADRIALALADAHAGRERTRRVVRVAPPLCAAAVLVALVVGLWVTGQATSRPVSRDDDLRASGAVAFGRDGAGALADPEHRRACLAGAGVTEAGAALLGGMPHSVDGTAGTLLVLGTGLTGRYHLVVVDTGCTRVLAESLAGR